MLLPAESLLLTPKQPTGRLCHRCRLCDAMLIGQSRTRLHERCIVSTETARAGVSTCKIYNNSRHDVCVCLCLHTELGAQEAQNA